MSDQPDYKSFLLRLWQVRSSAGSIWRASLEDPRTGIRLGFSGIRQLHEYLLEQTTNEQLEVDTNPPTTASSTSWQGTTASNSDPIE